MALWKPVLSMPGVLASDEGDILLPPSHQPSPFGGYRLVAPKPSKGYGGRARPYRSMSYYSRQFGTIRIHQAVCEAFHGPKPFPEAVVIHLDENPLNNRADNLKWGTQKENLNMPKFKEYARSRTGEDSPRTKWAARRRAA